MHGPAKTTTKRVRRVEVGDGLHQLGHGRRRVTPKSSLEGARTSGLHDPRGLASAATSATVEHAEVNGKAELLRQILLDDRVSRGRRGLEEKVREDDPTSDGLRGHVDLLEAKIARGDRGVLGDPVARRGGRQLRDRDRDARAGHIPSAQIVGDDVRLELLDDLRDGLLGDDVAARRVGALAHGLLLHLGEHLALVGGIREVLAGQSAARAGHAEGLASLRVVSGDDAREGHRPSFGQLPLHVADLVLKATDLVLELLAVRGVLRAPLPHRALEGVPERLQLRLEGALNVLHGSVVAVGSGSLQSQIAGSRLQPGATTERERCHRANHVRQHALHRSRESEP